MDFPTHRSHIRRVLVSLAAVIVASSCGGGGSMGDGGSGTRALVGTWGTTMCFGFCSAPDCGTCDNAYTFGADGRYSTTSSFVNSTTNTSYPGCTITVAMSGYTYSATDTQFSVTAGSSAAAVITRTGCMSTTDNQTPMPDPTFNPTSITHPNVPYAISGNTLTIDTQVLTRR